MSYSKYYADHTKFCIKFISEIPLDPDTNIPKVKEEDIDELLTATSRVKFAADFFNTIKFHPKLTSAISAGCKTFEYILTGGKLCLNVIEDGGIGKKTLLTVGDIVAGRVGGHIGSKIGTAICPVVGSVIGGFIGACIAELLYKGVTQGFFDVSGPCLKDG